MRRLEVQSVWCSAWRQSSLRTVQGRRRTEARGRRTLARRFDRTSGAKSPPAPGGLRPRTRSEDTTFVSAQDVDDSDEIPLNSAGKDISCFPLHQTVTLLRTRTKRGFGPQGQVANQDLLHDDHPRYHLYGKGYVIRIGRLRAKVAYPQETKHKATARVSVCVPITRGTALRDDASVPQRGIR